jgi:hypothetical protein
MDVVVTYFKHISTSVVWSVKVYRIEDFLYVEK